MENNIENEVLGEMTVACYTGDVDKVKAYIEAGNNINEFYRELTLLYYAVGNNQYEVVKLLLENGADYTIKYRTFLNYNVLDLALSRFRYDNGYFSVIKELLEYGAECSKAFRVDLDKLLHTSLKHDISKSLVNKSFHEGKLKNKIEIAKQMLKDNVPLDAISRYTGLSIEDLENITN